MVDRTTWRHRAGPVLWAWPLAWLAVAASVAGCSGSSSPDGDAGHDVANGDSAEGDATGGDGEGSDVEAGSETGDGEEALVDGLGPLPYQPVCGNGVLDDGEDCDDRNRLDGDGCDWQCHLGDGAPPPEPLPGVPDYASSGEPGRVGEVTPFGIGAHRLPLAWTGTEFATVLYERPDSGPQVRFRRFDSEGTAIDADWIYPAGSWLPDLELVWTGDGFALFYTLGDAGLFFQRLDVDGKPIGSPVLIEPDPSAQSPAADLLGDELVVVWHTEPGGAWSWELGPPACSVRARRLTTDGALVGPVRRVSNSSGRYADVAAGEDSVGIAFMVPAGAPYPSNATLFVRLDSELSAALESGVMSDGYNGDLKWIDGAYRLAWAAYDSFHGGSQRLCVAELTEGGALARAPVCTEVVLPESAGVISDVRLLWGGDGMVLVAGSGGWDGLFYQRADLNGTAVGDLRQVVTPISPEMPFAFLCIPFDATWVGDGFAILFMAWNVFPGADNALFLARYHAAE